MAQKKGGLLLIVVVEKFFGCYGFLRKDRVQPIYPLLKAEVGRTFLKPSDTRSFNRVFSFF